ncbi:MAG TPA: response regulator transcription factor [Spirochaetes bacterium]|nr:response regulator transcription factor [Spirochaetota bacterium]
MEITIGLLSGNSELIDDFTGNLDGRAVRPYRNVDSIRDEEFSLLAADADFFEAPDMIQFYLSKIRKKLHGKPVLLILRVSHLESLDLEWFFDEFVLFPFRKGELKTRIDRLLWNHNLFDDENIVTIGNLKINLTEYSVYMNNVKLDFTYKEFELLRLMVQNRGTVFTRKDLLAKIWGIEYIGGTRTVDVHIRRLRGKLGDEFNTVIETVRNVGYRCIA